MLQGLETVYTNRVVFGVDCYQNPRALNLTPYCFMLQGLETVYTGGRSSNELENSVERALTRRDVHGRVLTPKEAFRDLCHQCARLSHNSSPSVIAVCTSICTVQNPLKHDVIIQNVRIER